MNSEEMPSARFFEPEELQQGGPLFLGSYRGTCVLDVEKKEIAWKGFASSGNAICVAAAIVTYNPDLARLEDNLAAIAFQVDAAPIFGNASCDSEALEDLPVKQGRLYTLHSENAGLSRALNAACSVAGEFGASHVVLSVSVVEETAYQNGWIDRERLLAAADKYGKSVYGQHLRKVAEGKIIPHKEAM